MANSSSVLLLVIFIFTLIACSRLTNQFKRLKCSISAVVSPEQSKEISDLAGICVAYGVIIGFGMCGLFILVKLF
ncbi:MAG: hypothetical protein WC310_02680 [Patescibacteria group bacterium]|jgi:uncharacterized membrane protein YciS (DUF1049 family)